MSKKGKLIVGNWKMNPVSYKEAKDLFVEIVESSRGLKQIKPVICAPYVYLSNLLSLRTSKVFVGAEDCAPGDVGAVTGSISAGMLRELGVTTVILGHSERRAMGETDQQINLKLRSALAYNLSVILCVGESARDETGEYLNFIKQQLHISLAGIKKSSLKNLVVAYEPIWAIGKDAAKPATPEDAIEVAIFIKKVLSEMFGRDIGIKVPVLYGGSVDSKNCGDYLRDQNMYGLLVGRASLSSEKFAEILRIADAF